MQYEEALEALRGSLRFGVNPSLATITSLCGELDRPQDSFTSVQITGTNGKTSTARFTEALLRASGRRTALYTSPELNRYPERMEVGGSVVTDQRFADAIGAALAAAERCSASLATPPTEFELLTAAALWLFREEGVDAAVLEAGMGGRWDATSAVSPTVSVITSVGLDHTEHLGDTVEAIAAEKAAIIRPVSSAVLGPLLVDGRSVVARAASESGAPVAEPQYRVEARPSSPGGRTTFDVRTSIGVYRGLEIAAPEYQAANAATALAAAEFFVGGALGRASVSTALSEVRLPGRFELVSETPPVIVDGAHNPQAATVLAGAIADAWPDPLRRPHLILGVLGEKDAAGIVLALATSVSGIAVTRSMSPRALPVSELAAIVARITGSAPTEFADVRSAVSALRTRSADGLVVTGSLTLAGEARQLFVPRLGGSTFC